MSQREEDDNVGRDPGAVFGPGLCLRDNWETRSWRRRRNKLLLPHLHPLNLSREVFTDSSGSRWWLPGSLPENVLWPLDARGARSASQLTHEE